MKTGKRSITDGSRFNHLFPEAEGRNLVRKTSARLNDTVLLMKNVIATTTDQTRLLARQLKGKTPHESCANVWQFCFDHLQYEKDEVGKEQVRSPARTWRDRKRGVDCDCMTVFIGSILTNLGIPFVIRLTRYTQREFEHVYPVALINGKSIIMDCVVHRFNYEVPYTAKNDITMELQFLNGFEGWEPEEFIEGNPWNEVGIYPDQEQLLRDIEDDLEGLEGKAQRQARRDARKEKKAAKGKPTFKERFQKGAHIINRVNPGTALIRAGILAGMKLNIFNIAGRLRYCYLSDAEAAKRNIDAGKLKQLREVRGKFERIFYGAGGKPQNLKEAILTGRGNRDRKVPLNGLGFISLGSIAENDLVKIIGEGLYADEFDEVVMPGAVNGLGEAVSATASVAAASSILGAIAALIKKIGSIFKPGTPEAQSDALMENTAAAEDKQLPADVQQALRTAEASPPAINELTEMNMDEYAVTEKSASAGNSGDDNGGGVWQWIKDHPLLTAGIAAAGIGLTIWAVKTIRAKNAKKSKAKSKRSLNGVEGVEGLDGVRRKTTGKRKTKKSTRTKQTSQNRRGSTSARGKYPKVKLL